MRMWHIDLLEYLPDAQFRGQLRELVAIMHEWRDKGSVRHPLVSQVTNYPKVQFYSYFVKYCELYEQKYGKAVSKKIFDEFSDFCVTNNPDFSLSFSVVDYDAFWNNKIYLRICMANLYEKYLFGVGKCKITVIDWVWVCHGYRESTGENYVL